MNIVVSNRSVEPKEINLDKFKTTIPFFEALHPYFDSGKDIDGYVDYVNNVLKISNEDLEKARDLDSYLQSANNYRENIIQAFKNGDIGKFDKALLDKIDGKALPFINENDFYKLTFNISNFTDENSKKQIKEIFLQTQTNSFMDFKNIDSDDLELYYYKRGIYRDENGYTIANARDRVTLVENFANAKDNNFISAKFITDFSLRLSEAGFVNDSFSSEYYNGAQKAEIRRSISDILKFTALTKSQKQELIEKEKLSKTATDIAKKELKSENNSRRNSLKAGSNDNQIDNAFSNISLRANQKNEQEQTKINIANVESLEEISEKNRAINEYSIEEIISKSFELYRQKEREKTELRLNKAQKDSENAYFDLKKNIEESGSIIDALDYIRQKYGSEDTIRFASFQFTKDVFNSKHKDNEINDLKSIIKDLNSKISSHNEIIEKKESHISELKSAIAKKSAEVTRLNEEFNNQENSFKMAIEKQAEEFAKDTKNQINKISDEFKKILDDKEQELAEAEGIIDSLEKELGQVSAKNEKMQEQINEISSLKSKLDFISDEFKKTSQANRELLEENANLKANSKDIEALRSELINKNSQIQVLMEVLKNSSLNNLSQQSNQNSINQAPQQEPEVAKQELKEKEQDDFDLGIDKIIKVKKH